MNRRTRGLLDECLKRGIKQVWIREESVFGTPEELPLILQAVAARSIAGDPATIDDQITVSASIRPGLIEPGVYCYKGEWTRNDFIDNLPPFSDLFPRAKKKVRKKRGKSSEADA